MTYFVSSVRSSYTLFSPDVYSKFCKLNRRLSIFNSLEYSKSEDYRVSVTLFLTVAYKDQVSERGGESSIFWNFVQYIDNPWS